MKQKAFRITDEQALLLKEHAESRGMTESDVIREAIQNLGAVSSQGDAENNTGDALTEQLKAKDEEIRRLLGLLESSQEAVRAAQTLQAAQMALPDAGKREGRLKRAWRAFKGAGV